MLANVSWPRRHGRALALRWALLPLLVLAACGQPTVDYEVSVSGALVGHEKVMAACLSKCDAGRRGTGCDGAKASIEFGNPCDSACATEVEAALPLGACLDEQAAVWTCQGQQAWTCASEEAEPTMVAPQACASAEDALKACVSGGTPGKPAGPTTAEACQQKCAAVSKACGDKAPAGCEQDCADQAKALPEACTPVAAQLTACQAKGVACLLGAVVLPECTLETAALDTCKTNNQPTTGTDPQSACLATCAKVAQIQGCATYGEGNCKAECGKLATTPDVCKTLGTEYWNCLGKQSDWTCISSVGQTAGCGQAKSQFYDCRDDCSDGKCVCLPYEIFCKGDQVQRCSGSGKSMSLYEDCQAYGATCKDGQCVGGTPCSPAGFSCDGTKLTYCEGKATQVLKDCAASGQVCNDGECITACKPNQYFCDGEVLRQCTASGLASIYVEHCSSLSTECTTYTCKEGQTKCQVSHDAKGAYCSDKDPCTQNDQCDGSGTCVPGKPYICNDKVGCTVDSCEKGIGCGSVADNKVCDDNNACTVDVCDKYYGCQSEPAMACSGTVWGGSCYEAFTSWSTSWKDAASKCGLIGGHLATIASEEENQQAAAALAKKITSNYDYAFLGGQKTGSTWAWVDGTKFGYTHWGDSEDQSGSYTIMNLKGNWYSSSGASYSADGYVCERPAFFTCDDGQACTIGDKCVNDKCQAGAPACDDANACTLDLCDAATATQCSHKDLAQGATCDDGQACTKGDACDGAGACTPTTAVDCDDGNPCTQDSCTEPGGCQNFALVVPVACGEGLFCQGAACKPAGTCGDGAVNAVGEECDDGNLKDGDVCSGGCKVEATKSCALLKQALPNLPSGVYSIDPDGPGPVKVLALSCDFKDGAWTLVANVFDSAGNDIPDLPEDVTAGWQQAQGGGWEAVSTVTPGASGQASAAVGLDFVLAMSAFGSKNLRFCFVDQAGKDTVCRVTPSDLGLGGKAEGNPLLDPYADNALTWTFGRLVGLPASAASFDTAKLKAKAGYVKVKPGAAFEFGLTCADGSPPGLVESTAMDEWSGVWCLNCQGMCFRPIKQDDHELGIGATQGKGAQANPLPQTWGFRVYVGS